MDNFKPDRPETEFEPQPEAQAETNTESLPGPETVSESYLNERIQQAFDRVKLWFTNAKDHYLRTPRLQKLIYQGKYLPAFWTVACIFSLMVNALLLAILISFGHNFFELKALVAKGLVNGTSDSLALMDKAHIVTTVPVQTTVQLQDNLPVVFDLPINQSTQLSLAQDTRIPGAVIYLNNTAVTTDLTMPAGTSIQADFNMTIPVNTTVPISVTVPVALQVPVDIAIEQTDLHQSIIGLQGIIEPYKTIMGSAFNSPKEFYLCNQWWSGWMCSIFFGKQ